MKSGLSWSIRGVDEATRDAALEAARQSGMTLNEWIEQAIADRAAEEGIRPDALRDQPPSEDDRDLHAVTEAVAELTRRIRSMDTSARAAMSGLSGRLDEIEAHLGRAEAGERGGERRAKSLRDATAMIGRLAREIDNVDEAARSTVEGLRDRARPPAREREPGDAVGEAIRGLDQRIAAMAESLKPAPTPASVDRTLQLDDLRLHLDALLARAPQPPANRTAGIELTLRTLEERLHDAMAAAPPRPVPHEDREDGDRVRRIEATLADITRRLGASEPAPQPAREPGPERDELSAAIADIAARQNMLDERPAAEHREIADGIATLQAELSELANRIDLIWQEAAADQESRLSLDRRIEALAAEGPLGRSLLGDVRSEIEALRAAAARETTLIDGFEDIARRVSDRGHLDALGEEISALRQTLETDDSPHAVARLEIRVSELARTIETTLNSRHSAVEAANAGVAASLADIRGAIEDLAASHNPYLERHDRSVADVAAHLVEIRQIIEARDESGANSDSEAIARLESRIDDIAGRIDEVLGRTASIEAISGLHERLDGIAERFDVSRNEAAFDKFRTELAALRAGIDNRDQPRFDKLEILIRGVAARLDTSRQDAAFDEIRAELAAIRGGIDNREPPRFGELEVQIRELAERLDIVAGDDSDAATLADLEARIARLAADLDQTMPATIVLKQVEDDLVQLHGRLSETRDESVEAARAAARDAVAEFAGHPTEELTRSLRRDLETIRIAAGNSDLETKQTLQSLHATLGTVVERLARIEREPRPTAPTQSASVAPPASVRPPAPSQPVAAASGTEPSGLRPPAATVKAASPTDLGERPDRPLDTGAERPDPVAVREAPAVEAERRPHDRRADFIAAARRAAQAAVAETGTAATAAAEIDPDDQKPGAFTRIGQAIRNRRKSLLLAAAAIVVAIGAIQIFAQRGGPVDGIANERPPTVEEKAVAAAAAPTPVDAAKPAFDAAAVDGSALVAPPANAKAAMALASDDAVDTRFGAAFEAPGTRAFEGEGEAAPAIALDPTTTASIPVPPIGSDKLRAAATAGDPSAAFEIANRFAEGRGVAQSLENAAAWYKRSAEGGVAVAQYRLASLYERGQGVPRDVAQAMIWYQRAVDLGNIGAMHNLAVLMSEGAGGSPDNAKALELFLAAASYGVKDSQYNLGVIYARGLGQKPNLVESYKWFAVSAMQGDNDAATRRDEVAAMLKPDQLAAARAAVQTWRPKTPAPEANSVDVPDGGWGDSGAAITEADQTALVKKIQDLLTAQGYDPGPADGVDGPKTREAIRAFQRTIGVADTGAIDGNLVAVLAER